MTARIPTPVEKVSAAFNLLGVNLDDVVALHSTNVSYDVEEVVRDENGNVRTAVSDPTRIATTHTYYVIDYRHEPASEVES